MPSKEPGAPGADPGERPGPSSGDGAAPRARRRGDADLVPRPLAAAAAWSWRLVLVGATIFLAVWVLARIQVVVLPVIGALLICTFLYPVAARLRRARFPRALAALTVMIGALLVAGGGGYLLVEQARGDFSELDVNVRQGVADVEDWLVEGPFGIPRDSITDAVDQARDWAFGANGALMGNLATGAMVALEVVAGILLTLVLVFFFLKDGDRMWPWIARRLGRDAGPHVLEAGSRAWWALGGYMRGQAIVAAVDALFIGLGIFLLGVPFVLPLTILTFFAGFFPIVGAVTAGAIAVLVALASEGLVTALILLAIVVGVQQAESNVLEPIVMGWTVRMHPVVILVALGAGAAIAGLVGAFLAVPVAAAATAVGSYAWGRLGPEDQQREIRARERGDGEGDGDDEGGGAGTAAERRAVGTRP